MTSSDSNWIQTLDDKGICWLSLDKKDAATNVLTREVFDELDGLLDKLSQDPPVAVVLTSAKSSGFIAGADVNAFSSLSSEEQALEIIHQGQAIMDKIESLPCPSIALINGFCLGGGTEIALACTYRIALDDPKTRIGLPEVMVGIHPGFGGTVRSIRLLGPLAAMDLMLTGRTVDARRAQRMGLVDYAVPERQLRHAAEAVAIKPVKARQLKRMVRLANNRLVRPLLAWQMRKQVARKANPAHYPAPYALIDLWAKHADHPRRMYQEEARNVARLVMGETAQNLVRVFQLQTRLKALGDKKRFAPQHVHVIGGGLMGGDIAIWCALRGLRVTVQDPSPEALGGMMQRAMKLYGRRFKRQDHLTTAVMDRLIADPKGLGLAKADVVIEAIIEDAKIKQALYKDIEGKLKPDALIATNTSSIPLETLCTALERPERLVGLHFFNPVAKMPLVEIVRGAHSSDESIAKALAFTRHIDKLPLTVKSSPGFLVNRILMPYLLEAVILEQEGIPKTVIDKAALDFGMPMGPLALADTVGLDVCRYVGDILSKELGFDVPEKLGAMVASGHLGKKSGKGFYTYKKGQPVNEKAGDFNGDPKDVQDRLMMRLINEAVAVQREGVADEADLIDAGIIFGTGFAPFRGGPLHYLQAKGASDLRARLQTLAQAHGQRFEPDEGWPS